jgi:hypothetical protein
VYSNVQYGVLRCLAANKKLVEIDVGDAVRDERLDSEVVLVESDRTELLIRSEQPGSSSEYGKGMKTSNWKRRGLRRRRNKVLMKEGVKQRGQRKEACRLVEGGKGRKQCGRLCMVEPAYPVSATIRTQRLFR